MTTDFGPEDMVLWEDAAIADMIADVMNDHHDMDVSFADHARHIVSALRDNGLLADAALDVEGVRHELDRISVLAKATFGAGFHFATFGIWSHKTRGPDGVQIVLHLAGAAKATTFHAQDPAVAFREAEAWLQSYDPAAREAEGWAILGVVRA